MRAAPDLRADKASSDASARPHVFLLRTRAAYLGPSLDLAPHRNAVATLAIGLDAPFRLALADGGAHEHCAALIAAGARHHLRSTGRMAFLYLDPLSRDHDRLSGIDWRMPPECFTAAIARIAGAPTIGRLEEALARLGIGERAPKDRAVADAVALLEANPAHGWRVAELARAANLSVPRFQHRFADAMGLPFRRYRLWARLRLAVRRMAEGASLTTAAMDAGFASSAHLSTAFRAMFGIAPSRLKQADAAFLG